MSTLHTHTPPLPDSITLLNLKIQIKFAALAPSVIIAFGTEGVPWVNGQDCMSQCLEDNVPYSQCAHYCQPGAN
ncbi:hypothetical protein A4X13_0g2473 [Tilletia indica]|uniref:Uncharacterized protein n=1 Tax=Tilletia indica TaxID=43049 RepID=A0A177TDH7_9BASI|nr:hypothetical protein A4X13_0g2473 [Tilletia indica]